MSRRASEETDRLVVVKSLMAAGDYHYSAKVQALIEDGCFGTEDLESCIATAKNIHKIEEDELKSSTDGCKYTILGRDSQGAAFYTCGKIVLSEDDERLYFFITAHDSERR